jgi:hypothetical protein
MQHSSRPIAVGLSALLPVCKALDRTCLLRLLRLSLRFERLVSGPLRASQLPRKPDLITFSVRSVFRKDGEEARWVLAENS